MKKETKKELIDLCKKMTKIHNTGYYEYAEINVVNHPDIVSAKIGYVLLPTYTDYKQSEKNSLRTYPRGYGNTEKEALSNMKSIIKMIES